MSTPKKPQPPAHVLARQAKQTSLARPSKPLVAQPKTATPATTAPKPPHAKAAAVVQPSKSYAQVRKDIQRPNVHAAVVNQTARAQPPRVAAQTKLLTPKVNRPPQTSNKILGPPGLMQKPPRKLSPQSLVRRSRSGCGCGGGCGCGPERAAAEVERFEGQDEEVIQPKMAAPHGEVIQLGKGKVGVRGGSGGTGVRKNPPRNSTPSRLKRLTRRQQALLGFKPSTVKLKIPRNPCPAGRNPASPNWHHTLWNGNSRYAWSPAAAALLGPLVVCAWPAGCANAAAHRDHIIPYRRYINDNGALETFCDGTCHYLGVSVANATALYNNIANLRPLCAMHNGQKAILDAADPFNVNYPPDLVGRCIGGPCPGCNADHCL